MFNTLENTFGTFLNNFASVMSGNREKVTWLHTKVKNTPNTTSKTRYLQPEILYETNHNRTHAHNSDVAVYMPHKLRVY